MARGRLSIVALGLLTGLAVLTARPAEAKLASLVIDAKTGQVIEANNPDARTYPASLTKMMTLYLTFEALKEGRLQKNQRLRVTPHAAVQAPSKLELAPGETITVEQAVLALTVKSANDAAVVLAEAVGGTEARFAELMTQKARQLGMTATRFRNASGLPDPGQVTTARDMATLAQALIRDYPLYYPYFSAREFTFQGVAIPTHNHVLVNYEGADGLKTGYIHASGFNLVTSAVRDGRRLIGVVLGGRSSAARDLAMMRLLDAGFSRTPRLSQASYAPPSGDALGVAAGLALAKEAGQSRAKPAVPAEETALASVLASIAEGGANQAADAESDSHETGWGVQVGAYAHFAQARIAALKAQQTTPALAKATVVIGRPHAGNGAVYRARLMGLSETQARAACGHILRHKGGCLVVNPTNERTLAAIVQ